MVVIAFGRTAEIIVEILLLEHYHGTENGHEGLRPRTRPHRVGGGRLPKRASSAIVCCAAVKAAVTAVLLRQ